MKIFYRADINKEIGSGHFMRGVYLGHYAKKLKVPFFVISNYIPENLRKIAKKEKIKTIQGKEDEFKKVEKVLKKYGKGIWITDGDKKIFYEEKYQKYVRKKEFKLCTITFNNNTHFFSDFLHNQNIRANFLKYHAEKYTKFFLGLSYLIINPQVSKALKDKRKKKKKLIFITFGAVDKGRNTERIIDALLQDRFFNNFHFNIVLGALNNRESVIRKKLNKYNISHKIHKNVEKIGELMVDSYLAFSSGGLTVWELGVLKIPTIILPFSKREIITADFLEKSKLCFKLDRKWSIEKMNVSIKKIIKNEKEFKKRTINLSKKINPLGAEKFLKELKKYEKR